MTSKEASDMPPPTEPPLIISLEELMQTVEAVQSKENVDKHTLTLFFQTNEIELKDALKVWAAKGFPNNYIVFEIQLHKLEKCIDGQTREIMEYIQYLCPDDTIYATLSKLQSRLPGMALSYSYTTDFQFCVHVSRL